MRRSNSISKTIIIICLKIFVCYAKVCFILILIMSSTKWLKSVIWICVKSKIICHSIDLLKKNENWLNWKRNERTNNFELFAEKFAEKNDIFVFDYRNKLLFMNLFIWFENIVVIFSKNKIFDFKYDRKLFFNVTKKFVWNYWIDCKKFTIICKLEL